MTPSRARARRFSGIPCPTSRASRCVIGCAARFSCRSAKRRRSPARWRRPWTTRTAGVCSTGTSSRRTSSSPKGTPSWPTSASHARSAPTARRRRDERLTGTGLTLGTPAYMSPEQATGADRLDARSDVYSLGCALFEMLAGEPPFTGPTAQAVIAKRFTETVPSTRRGGRVVPEELDRIVLRALAPVPADRFPSAAAFAEALRAGHPWIHRATERRQTPPRRRAIGRGAALRQPESRRPTTSSSPTA